MGKMHFVHDFSEKQVGLQAIMAHYTKKSEHVFKEEMVHRTMVMRLDIEENIRKRPRNLRRRDLPLA